MGKDIRGIERGKCACGECDDFMRSDGPVCGYCGCLLTRHSKKDTRSSSETVSRNQEDGTSEVREQVRMEVQRSGKMKT